RLLSMTLGSVMLLSALLTGCCGECENQFLGDFLVRDSSKEWLAPFANTTRVFRNQNGQTTTLTYGDALVGEEPLFFNCVELPGTCGLCCDDYTASFFGMTAQSTNGEYVFQFVVRKDFVQQTPNELPADVDDSFSIDFNQSTISGFRCELFQLSTVELNASITLNNESFSGVLVCEDQSVLPNQPTGIYYNKEDGIVGWRLGDDEVWALEI
ncbi:MAG: hypothetical protein AAFR59_12105, partial [Bacteroidota bacterium]